MSEPTPLKHGTGLLVISLVIRDETYETPVYFDTESISKTGMREIFNDGFESFWENFEKVRSK